MSKGLPAPDIVRRYVEDFFHPSAPALSLRWPGSVAHTERLWELPDGVHIVCRPPDRFGYQLRRHGPDAYSLKVLWNGTCLNWESLTRMQLLSSALSPLLASLGTDLWCLLDQPVRGEQYTLSRAA